jgi:hypothetical protein
LQSFPKVPYQVKKIAAIEPTTKSESVSSTSIKEPALPLKLNPTPTPIEEPEIKELIKDPEFVSVELENPVIETLIIQGSLRSQLNQQENRNGFVLNFVDYLEQLLFKSANFYV